MATIEQSAKVQLQMPGWLAIGRRAGTTVLIVTVLPMLVFYSVMSAFGLRTAVLATLGWYYAGMLLNIIRGKPVLAAALLGAGLLSIRAAVMFLTGSTLIYFLQPVAATLVTATVFAVSALARRPVLDRLAHDFCPFPAELSARLRERRFFCWLSLVWSSAYLIDAAGTVWLLTRSSVSDFVLLKTVFSPLLTATAVFASYVLLRIMTRHDEVVIRWSDNPVEAGPALAAA